MNEQRSIAYKFTPIDTVKSNYVLVEITLTIKSKAILQLIIPEQWIDATNLDENIKNLTCNSPHAYLLDSVSSNSKLLINTSDMQNQVCLSYELHGNRTHPFKAQITDDFCFFIGKVGLITLTDDLEYDFYLQWCINDNLQVANSFGLEKHQFFKSTFNVLRESVFTFGDIKISLLDKITIGDFYLVTNTEKYFIDKTKIQEIISYQLNVMNEDKLPYYLIIDLVFDNDYTGPIMATNLYKACLFCTNASKPELSFLSKVKLLSHEFFHCWLGQKLKPASDYLNSMWFFEGFTEYLSLELLKNGKFLDENDYLEYQNRLWRHYRSHYLMAISNREQALHYWDNPELESLPYVKGYLFAQYCQHLLTNSESELTLIDVVSSMVTQYNQSHLTEAMIIQLLSSITGINLAKPYARFFIENKLFKPLPLNNANYIKDEFIVYDYGIDVLKSFMENRLLGISKLHGLLINLEGIQIKPLKLDLTFSGLPLTIVYLDKADCWDKIEIKPIEKTINLPRYCKIE